MSRLISRCDAMCPGRWTGGKFSAIYHTCKNLSDNFANLIHPHLINATRTRSAIPQNNPQPPPTRVVPLLSLHLPLRATFLRSRPIDLPSHRHLSPLALIRSESPFTKTPGFLVDLRCELVEGNGSPQHVFSFWSGIPRPFCIPTFRDSHRRFDRKKRREHFLHIQTEGDGE